MFYQRFEQEKDDQLHVNQKLQLRAKYNNHNRKGNYLIYLTPASTLLSEKSLKRCNSKILFYRFLGPLRSCVFAHSCFHEQLRRRQLCHRRTMLMPFWSLGALRFKCPLNPQPNILVVWSRHIDTLGKIERSSAIDSMNTVSIVEFIFPPASPAQNPQKSALIMYFWWGECRQIFLK